MGCERAQAYGRTRRSGEREVETPQSISVTHGSNPGARHAPLGSTRARKHPRTASDSNQHLPSTQLSVSVPERLRDLGPHDGINGKQKPSLDATATSHSRAILSSPNFHVHEQWEVVPDACSTVCLSASAVLRATKEPSLVRKHEELGSVRRGRQLGDGGKGHSRVLEVCATSRVTSAMLCEGRAAPWAFSEEGPARFVQASVGRPLCPGAHSVVRF